MKISGQYAGQFDIVGILQKEDGDSNQLEDRTISHESYHNVVEILDDPCLGKVGNIMVP